MKTIIKEVEQGILQIFYPYYIKIVMEELNKEEYHAV